MISCLYFWYHINFAYSSFKTFCLVPSYLHSLLPIVTYHWVSSDTENFVDTQVPFLPSVEVLVKALVVISPAVLAGSPNACVQILFCSHHPFLVGSAKRNAVWKVSFLFFQDS